MVRNIFTGMDVPTLCERLHEACERGWEIRIYETGDGHKEPLPQEGARVAPVEG